MKKTQNLVLIGLPGAGKTTIGRELAKALKWDFIDLDRWIVEQNGLSIDEMFAIDENYFRERETEACLATTKMSKTVIATGGGVVNNPENMAYLKVNGRIIYIDRPIKQILRHSMKNRPLLRDNPDKIYVLDKERRPLYEEYADTKIINKSVRSTINKILEQIGAKKR